MTYFDITIKTADLSLDDDDIQTIINIIGQDNIKITDCDDYTLPDFVMNQDIESILEYISNIDDLGVAYELYCEDHHTICDKSDFESSFIGEYDNHYSIVEEYLSQHDIPSPIINCIDYKQLVDELEYTVLESYRKFYVFSN